MSAFKILAAGLAASAPLAAAYTKPVGDSPSGNAISQPGLNSIVPVGEAFTVTWEPTKKDCATVDLVLLKGPASNAIPQYAIAENIDNKGTFAWTPKKDLAPSDAATPAMGYGIQLICDKSGAYQYTTQFGISNPDYKPTKEAPTSSAMMAPAGYGAVSTSSSKPSSMASSMAASSPSASAQKPAHTSAAVAAPVPYNAHNHTQTMTGTAAMPMSTGAAAASGYKPSNSSMMSPTGASNMSTTLATSATLSATGYGSGSKVSATASSSPVATGAAAQLATSLGGLVFAAGVAIYAL